MFLGLRLNRAVDKPRLHHQLEPNSIQYEEDFDKVKFTNLIYQGGKSQLQSNSTQYDENIDKVYKSDILKGNKSQL